MASQGDQSLDSLIACVVSMGFEFEDAQLAVQNGKLSVEEAIDWIVQGKPAAQAPAAQGAVLKLNRPDGEDPGPGIGSNPFRTPVPIAAPTPSTTVSVDKTQDVPMEEEKLTSRINRNQEQRLFKQRYEEKQREEAQKRAKQERLANKKEHESILKEIAKDRELQKLRKTHVAQTPGSAAPSAEAAAKPAATSPPEKTHDKCLLQIRLPDGRALRETFTPETMLREVWTFVSRAVPDHSGMCLMQPFPRQEYNDNHMHMTMQELKLVPSGSLVLKKATVTSPDPATSSREPGDGSEMPEKSSKELPSPPSALSPAASAGATLAPPPQENADTPAGSPLNHPLPPPLEMEDDAPAAPSHQWGSGNRLGYTDDMDEGEGDEGHVMADGGGHAEEDGMDVDVSSDESDEDMPGPGFGLPGIGMGIQPAGHPGGQQAIAHDWGFGQALDANPNVLEPQHMAHHGKTPKQLAGAAACERFAAAPLVEPTPSPSVSHSHHAVESLTSMLIHNVTSRICDTRHPILGLQSMPLDVAMKILNHLIKERLLKPKTLNVFLSCRLKRLLLDSYPYVTNELLASIRLHPSLTHLSLGACPLITDKGLAQLQTLHRLRYLSLLGCPQITDPAMLTVRELPCLQTLVLEGTGITDQGISLLSAAAATKLRNLQQLHLNRTGITQKSFTHIAAFSNLLRLSLESTQVTGLEGLTDLQHLEVLNLSYNAIPTECLSVLGQMHDLTALSLFNMPLAEGDTVLSYIAGLRLQLIQLPNRQSTTSSGIHYLKDMPLHSLDLTNYTQVSSTCAPSIGNINSLRKLYLSNTGIDDEGMLCLQGLSNLEELHLDRTHVSDRGIEVVRAFHNLQVLSLSETSITNQCLHRGIFNDCQMLSRLNLSRTNITTKGAVELQLLYLTLLNLDGTGVRDEVEEVLKRNCPQLRRVTLANILQVPHVDEPAQS